jgi:HlyD family secretion protein
MSRQGSTPSVLRKLVAATFGLLLVAGAAWGYWQWKSSATGGGRYRTQPVTRGNLVATITATGTLVPEEVIDIGAQVAGQILRFGPDLDDPKRSIDYRSRVEPGTVMAQIDPALYKAEVDIAGANLAVAQAEEERAKTDLETAKTKLNLATRDWERARRLYPGAMAQSDYDTFQNTYQTSRVAVPGAEAALLKATKSVEMCKATLEKAKTNLNYATICSPVKGVVIDRRVNIGQTVIASLNAPSLFLVAKDLTRMQVWASVNEADVGAIHPGQAVTFTVDTFPQDVFNGKVAQIRYNATMNQNVVTYTVVVDTPNKDLRLLPYLTANLSFKVDERSQALLVPNAALRWRPTQPDQVAPEYRDAYEQARRRRELAEEGKSQGPEEGRRQAHGTVWVEDGGFVRPIQVRLGLTDGNRTEVVEVKGAELVPEAAVVTGENRAKNGAAPAAENPFAPKVFGGKKAP